jgi:hypothetical protein
MVSKTPMKRSAVVQMDIEGRIRVTLPESHEWLLGTPKDTVRNVLAAEPMSDREPRLAL